MNNNTCTITYVNLKNIILTGTNKNIVLDFWKGNYWLMVSKNNRLEKFQQSAQRQNHFSIRKLSIGAASVLLGTSLYLGTQTSSAQAAEQNGGVKPTL